MHKVLLLLLIPCILVVLFASFFMLSLYQQPSAVLGARIVTVAASDTQPVHPSPSPTVAPTATPSPTPSSPSPTPSATPTPTVKSSPPASVSNKEEKSSAEDPLLAGINTYRASQGLSPVHSDQKTCDFAATRANEIVSNFSHEGFTQRINAHTLPYASYSEVTENIAETSDPSTVVPMWIASAGHAANMRADTPLVCVRRSGDFYAYEGLRP